MKHIITLTAAAVIVVASLASSVTAQGDTLKVTYQGYLTDSTGSPVPNGTYEVTFRVYDIPVGGAPLASETIMVDATDGLFTALLASFSEGALDGLLFPPGPKPKKLYLEIQVAGDAPLVPRTELGTVPHSVVSRRISGDIVTGPGLLTLPSPGDTGISVEIIADSGGVSYTGGVLNSLKSANGLTTGWSLQADTFGTVSQVLQSAPVNNIIYLVNFLADTGMADASLMRIDDLSGDTTSSIMQMVDPFGLSIELQVGDERFMGLRCDKKVSLIEAIHTDEFGDTTGMAVLSVDSAFGPSISLEVGDKQFLEMRCDKKVVKFEALHTDEFGDTTGMIVQRVDTNGTVSLLGEQGDDVYSTVLDGASITTRYSYDGLDRLVTTVDSDGGQLVFVDAGGDTSAVLGESGLTVFNPVNTLDITYLLGEGIVFVDSSGDTTVSLTPDGILDIVYLLKAGGAWINEAAGTRRTLRYNTDGSRRFEAAVNQSAETGSDAGSDYVIARFDDAGSPLGAALFIERSSGDVGIATTNPGYKLDVQGSIGGTGGLYHASDRRLKKEVRTLDDAIDKVSRLRGVSFQWRTDEYGDMNLPDGQRIGLIAQEVEEVLQEVVTTGTNGYKAVEYGNIVALLIEATKEQQQTIDDLKSEVHELTALVRSLAVTRSDNSVELARTK